MDPPRRATRGPPTPEPTLPPILALPIELLAIILRFAARDSKLAIFTLWNVCHGFQHCMQNYVHIGELHVGYFLEVAARNIHRLHGTATPNKAAAVVDIIKLLPQLPHRLPPNTVHYLNFAADWPGYWQIHGLGHETFMSFIEHFRTITHFDAEDTMLEEITVTRIVTTLPKLRKLDLSGTGCECPGVTNSTIADLGNARTVKELELAHTHHLTDPSPLKQLELEKLAIKFCENIDAGMLHIVLINQKDTIKHLDLTRCVIDDMDTVVRGVAQLTNLTFLGLDGLIFTPEHATALNNLVNLEELDLAGTWGIEGGLDRLELPELVKITLSEIEEMTMDHLAGFTATRRKNLLELDITYASFEIWNDHAAMAMVSGHTGNRFVVTFSLTFQAQAQFRAHTHTNWLLPTAAAAEG
jgi:hypothetical protein